MDGNTPQGGIPTTDDQDLANLLAGLNHDQHEAVLPTEGADHIAAGPDSGPTPVTNASVDDNAASTSATAPVEDSNDAQSSVPPVAPVETANVATPNPMNVIDELNRRDTAPAIVGSTTAVKTETNPQPPVTLEARTLEPLQLDAATIAAATDEANQKVDVAMNGSVDAVLSAAEELNAIRDKILNYLSEMLRDINQPPKEKFETIVSVLRGTGDRSLLKDALETALKIDDPSDRAKALVDLVNALDELSTKK